MAPVSTSRALRYFSTHCWQKKHAASGTMSLLKAERGDTPADQRLAIPHED
jgi:hypothetical protein